MNSHIMERSSRIIVSLIIAVLVLLSSSFCFAEGNVMAMEKFEVESEGDIKVTIFFDSEMSSVTFKTPSGDQIDLNDKNVHLMTEEHNAIYIIQDAEVGEWTALFDPKSNEHVRLSMEEVPEAVEEEPQADPIPEDSVVTVGADEEDPESEELDLQFGGGDILEHSTAIYGFAAVVCAIAGIAAIIAVRKARR